MTVLFADVVHSMDIAAALGAERLREIMADLVDRAAMVVQRYGGTVDKFTGDGIMAVFGAPVALEDHAVRACLGALGVQEEAKRLAVDVHARDSVDLQLRVGTTRLGTRTEGSSARTSIAETIGIMRATVAGRFDRIVPAIRADKVSQGAAITVGPVLRRVGFECHSLPDPSARPRRRWRHGAHRLASSLDSAS